MLHLEKQLLAWRLREYVFRLAWSLARWAAIVLAVLIVCCLIDWFYDRAADTPFFLRLAMSLGQIALAIGLAVYFFRLRVPPVDTLAGRAEDAFPEFDHRLVTALQLNRPTARTEGMSRELIDAVTREAESLAARHKLASLAESWRGYQAALLFLVIALVLGLATLRPTLTATLLKRQLLVNLPIARSVTIENATPELLPAGDTVRLAFRVRGQWQDNSTGTVTIQPDGMPEEKYPLKYDSKLDGETALFIAELPPTSTPFHFSARLLDGRTRTPNRVAFAPRPVVNEVSAWLVLPLYVDPDGKTRYERNQPQGEVTTLPDCGLRVDAVMSKPVSSARLVLYARPDGRTEAELSRIPMVLDGSGTRGSCRVELIPPSAVAYRVHVQDENGFANANPPRRGIGSANYQAPSVRLLPEILRDPSPASEDQKGTNDDFAMDGMPLLLGGQVRIAYHARSPLGIGKAFIWYRVNPSDREKDAWTPLPLTPVIVDPAKVGRFVPELGLFETSGLFGQVEMYLVPSTDPASEPPGLEAGGCYNFQTAALTKTLPDGKRAKLEVGDQVEFLVAVYDRRPGTTIAGESQSRIKAVVTQEQLNDWLSQLAQSQGRLEELYKKQRRVFQANDEKNAPPRP